jgi:hypothetical protein
MLDGFWVIFFYSTIPSPTDGKNDDNNKNKALYLFYMSVRKTSGYFFTGAAPAGGGLGEGTPLLLKKFDSSFLPF